MNQLIDDAFDELQRQYPLPPGWRLGERFVEPAQIAQLELQLVGLLGELDAALELGAGMGRQVTGSAAGAEAAPARRRAYFELLERVNVVEVQRRAGSLVVRDSGERELARVPARELLGAPLGPELRVSYSNGVACGVDWQQACRSAWFEAIERDALLRSWYGQLQLERCELAHEPALSPLSGAQAYYRVEAYALEHCGAFVAFVVAWPLAQPELEPPPAGVPLVYGAAARASLAEALQAASGECAQRLGFLWGEELPEAPPPLVPGPEYHQEYYLVKAAAARLGAWLAGEHRQLGAQLSSPPPAVGIESASFVELTPALARGRYAVVKAQHPGLLPLVFGHGHPQCTHLPDALRVHPIA